MLIGPINHIKHLVSKERLPFSIAYLTSLGLTLYFSLGVRPLNSSISFLRSLTLETQIQSYLGSLIGAIVQVRLPIQRISWSSSMLTFSVCAGHRTRFIRTRLLPRRHADAALRRPNGAARGGQPASVLTVDASNPGCTRTALYCGSHSCYLRRVLAPPRLHQNGSSLHYNLLYNRCCREEPEVRACKEYKDSRASVRWKGRGQ